MRLLSILTFLFVLFVVPALAQQAIIGLGKSPLPINQYFTVSISAQDQPIKDYTPFPEIEGFKKSSKFSSTKTIITGGETTIIYTITQNYAALDEGEYEIEPFSMKVNGQTVQTKRMVLKITPMVVSDFAVEDDEQAVEEAEEDITEPEFINKDDNAFLTLYLDKEEVYVGEGVNVALYFYLAEEDQRLLEFYNFEEQITTLLRQLKQPNVWEEAFDFTEVTPEHITVQGHPYLRFKLYEAVLYPINSNPIKFPALSLQMIKYKVAKNPSLLTEDRQEGYKTYFAREREVLVKELPPHPLRNMVPVGNYRLRESLSSRKVPVNKSFNYLFQIEGEGNLAAIVSPTPTPPAALELYPPDIRQDITKRAGRVTGAKTFTYHVLAREPGNYNLSDVVEWIYFNPTTATYDTLQAKLTASVVGQRDNNAMILSRDLGPFYKIIDNEDATLQSLHQVNDIKRYTNIILVVLLAISSFVFIRSKKQ
ncbi:BatD family protein [Pontibacter harenae]|uniref:BatD family protein n=1 Tax=Pontibacter harenae TaxID=2894083 RepID=UPI001E637B40|nr:BatD family protein [Pontibacter harenae]MCC9165957.1 BatD family protein [Pontibacter harenae]